MEQIVNTSDEKIWRKRDITIVAKKNNLGRWDIHAEDEAGEMIVNTHHNVDTSELNEIREKIYKDAIEKD